MEDQGEKDPIKTKINDMANLKEGATKRRTNDNMGGAQKIWKERLAGENGSIEASGVGLEEKKLSGLKSILHFEKTVQGKVIDWNM